MYASMISLTIDHLGLPSRLEVFSFPFIQSLSALSLISLGPFKSTRQWQQPGGRYLVTSYHQPFPRHVIETHVPSALSSAAVFEPVFAYQQNCLNDAVLSECSCAGGVGTHGLGSVWALSPCWRASLGCAFLMTSGRLFGTWGGCAQPLRQWVVSQY